MSLLENPSKMEHSYWERLFILFSALVLSCCPSGRRVCWSPLQLFSQCSCEEHAFAAPSRMLCTMASPSLSQLQLSKAQRSRTCGIKGTLGAHGSARREQKPPRPKTLVYFYTPKAEWYFSSMFSFAEPLRNPGRLEIISNHVSKTTRIILARHVKRRAVL